MRGEILGLNVAALERRGEAWVIVMSGPDERRQVTQVAQRPRSTRSRFMAVAPRDEEEGAVVTDVWHSSSF